ncbi:MAG: LPS export ABC transporter periplasmic protein LptC [Desulfuromonadales bacterium]|nr:LPS export ABC transporter periplasmic protein LptC [Desulfuromonadales bacterium]MDT8423811.1 LPS export ABC transporter periplasmic protein LptC [Desulfuromonadales bacterium]
MNGSVSSARVGCLLVVILCLMLLPFRVVGATLSAPQSDLVIDDFAYTEYRAGTRRWALQAKSARHDFAVDITRAEVVHLQVFSQQDKPYLRLWADFGVMKIAERIIELNGSVIVEDQRGYRFLTDRLVYDDRRQLASGAGPVQMFSPGLKITGRGYDYAAATGIFQIHEEIEAFVTAPLKTP